MEISYSIMTLEEIELYQYYYFECDGDKKKIIAKEKEKE